MIGKRILRTCGVLVLALALAVLPGVAQSAMWVGGQLGANFAANTDVDASGNAFGVDFSVTAKGAKVEPSVIGGVTIGYDFIREGFLGYNWPDWMKYFSFATDFTFNRFDMREQFLDFTATIGGAGLSGKGTLGRSEGTMAVWSFLFIGKYGFFPDSEVPFGRLVPYIGVGPGIVFSTMDTATLGGTNNTSSSVDIALVVEAGIRFMALKNVSLDAAFRYRWCQPSYNFTFLGTNQNVNAEIDANQFSALMRANYHF